MTNRRGVVADPEIVRLAERVAGVVGEVMELDKKALLERPRPTDELRAGRYIIIAILHHHFCYNQKTGAVARRSPATTGTNWAEISQQRIAAALKRDRGVISDAWHAMEEAINFDFDVAYALDAIADTIVPIVECADAWKKALRQSRLDAARGASEDVDAGEGEAPHKPGDAIALRCHACRGNGTIRIHRLTGDPRYQAAWAVAESQQKSPDGFHALRCNSCAGTGKRLIESRHAARE